MIHKQSIRMFLGLALLAVPLFGCAAKYRSVTPYQPYEVGYTWDESDSTGSLFPSDQAVLSNDDIERILSASFALPDNPRLAVMKVGGHQRYWSEHSPILDQETTEAFLSALRQSPRVTYAAALPGILVPERLSVPYLREAAARFQADTLLVYRVETGSFEKYRSIHEDQVKAYCSIEAALLDVRSGTVPFTTVAYESVQGQRAEGDLNFDETIERAYKTAEATALQQIANNVISYLNGLPPTKTP